MSFLSILQAISLLLLVVAVIMVFMYLAKIFALDIYRILVLVLLLSLAISLHGIAQRGL